MLSIVVDPEAPNGSPLTEMVNASLEGVRSAEIFSSKVREMDCPSVDVEEELT